MKINNNIDEKGVVIGGWFISPTEIFQLTYLRSVYTYIVDNNLIFFAIHIRFDNYFHIFEKWSIKTIESSMSMNTFWLFVRFRLSSPYTFMECCMCASEWDLNWKFWKKKVTFTIAKNTLPGFQISAMCIFTLSGELKQMLWWNSVAFMQAWTKKSFNLVCDVCNVLN